MPRRRSKKLWRNTLNRAKKDNIMVYAHARTYIKDLARIPIRNERADKDLPKRVRKRKQNY